MDRRKFLGRLAGAAGATMMQPLLQGAQPAASSVKIGRPPNIVFFLVDDLGWGDFGCYGDKFHETPNIDKLAREGVRFTSAYAAAPVCSPSRAGILTGQAPARLHLTQWIPGVQYPHKKLQEPPTPSHLQAGLPTIATQLRQLGYQTAAIGKWHLGGEGSLPENFGFDVNIAGDEEGHPPAPNNYFGPWHFHNLSGYSKDDYLTEVLTQKMDDFLDQAAPSGPFFLYMAEYAVHLPLQERERLIAKYRQKNGGKDEPDPVYAAMVESVDTALGNLRSKLQALKVADNTIIVLTSDNGGVGFQAASLHRIADNGVWRAGKGFLYEGGLREPLIVHWPGTSKPGSVCDVPVTGLDFLPTLLSIAGSRKAPLPCDGEDISNLLRGGTSLSRENLFWHYPHYSDQGGLPCGAIRAGDWKLVEFFEDEHLELYNLSLDPGEQYDFSSHHEDKAAELHAKLVKWRVSVNAAMPTRNPNYQPELTQVKVGVQGCSWDPSKGCLVD